MSNARRQESFRYRVSSAKIARDRDHPEHVANGEETRYTNPTTNELTYIGSFTKGLPHNRRTGIIESDSDFTQFVDAINSGDVDEISRLPLGPQNVPKNRRFRSGIASKSNTFPKPTDVRGWESMGAGLAFDLEGPDAQAVTMPPAPKLDSDELVTEMTENYWMALIRDTNFTDFESNSRLVQRAVDSLNDTTWIKFNTNQPDSLTNDEQKRLRGPFTTSTVFRGITPGDSDGPYISQFLLTGTTGIDNIQKRSDGFVQYGGQRIDQRVRVARANRDYMTTWESFLDVQNGADVRGREVYRNNPETAFRFITNPRDISTYVHFDALYQAYLNACIIMLDMKVPFDSGLPFIGPDSEDKQQGFAHFGGPHILSLVTEVATRALKAVRFQKYNIHRRLRPEAVAGLLERFSKEPNNELFAGVQSLHSELDNNLLSLISAENARQNTTFSDFGNPRVEDFSPDGGRSTDTLLLPMAFPEGSPMHPSYGAGHAAVAGACVTVLKAFFDHTYKLPTAFVPNDDGTKLVSIEELEGELTVEGELNKLCSNISIGRNWAGVHYFTDYIESIALGEEVALGILQEQAGAFVEKFKMTVPLFDSSRDAVTIKNFDSSDPSLTGS